MAIANPVQRLTEAEYLKLERAAEVKSEFFEGEIFTMSGGKRWHSLIAANTSRALGNALAQGKCLVFDSNMRVKIEATGLYTYPDVSVACEPPRFVDHEMDTLVNPTVLVEVLSDSTEAHDRGRKAENYRQIASLREYVMISQSQPHVEQYIRQPTGDWLLRETAGLKKELVLVSLSVSIPLGDIFSKVEFQSMPIRTVRPLAR